MMSRTRTDTELSMAEDHRMAGRDPDAGVSIPDLLSTATSLVERVDGPLLLNSPRPHELSAMLGAIAACLTDAARRQ